MAHVLNTLVHSQMFVYDMKTGKEERLPLTNAHRSNHAAIVMEKSIYVFGGLSKGVGLLSSCERYVETKIQFQVFFSRFLQRIQLFFHAAMIWRREHGKS